MNNILKIEYTIKGFPPKEQFYDAGMIYYWLDGELKIYIKDTVFFDSTPDTILLLEFCHKIIKWLNNYDKAIIKNFFYKSDEFHNEPTLFALYYQKENHFKLDSDWKKYDSQCLISKSEIEEAFFEYINNLKKDIVKIFGSEIWDQYLEGLVF